MHALKGLALPRASHSGEIALTGSRRLRSAVVAGPVFFAHVATWRKHTRFVGYCLVLVSPASHGIDYDSIHLCVCDSIHVCVCARDSMHWSLLIVCHPGASMQCPSLTHARYAEQVTEHGGEHCDGLTPYPCILHLDSLSCHPTDSLAKRVRRCVLSRVDWLIG